MLPFLLIAENTEDVTLLEELFDNHSGRMFAAANRILENRHDAEDALQDTFIKIYNNIDSFRNLSEDNLILLLIIYVRNTARDILRRRNTVLRHTADSGLSEDGEPLLYDIPDPEADTADIVIKRETISRTREYIDSLPEAQRDVILMKYRLGMKEKEIASALGISETAVSSRILRAKDGLRKKMGEDFNT